MALLKKFVLPFCFLCSLPLFAQTQVTIGWDTSLSMNDRNIQKEFDFLDKYFGKYTEAQVTVIEFNNTNSTNRNYEINGGDWGIVKAALATSDYDGGTSYQSLNSVPATHTLLLFTDGKENALSDGFKRSGNLYVVNSNRSNDAENLKYLALANKGRLISLVGPEDTTRAQKLIYSGNVYAEDVAASDVVIKLKGSGLSVVPDADGNYKIEAVPGEVLIFQAGGMSPVEKVLDENNTLNVFIKSGGIELDQVVVTGDKKRDPDNKAIVGGVIKDKRMQGFATSKIGDKDINTIQSTVSDATEGKFSGVSRGTNQDLSQSVIRGSNSIFGNNYALIIIDGAPVARSNSGGRVQNGLQLTDFIDPNNIAEVEVLKGYAATNRYGSEGSGGVILITTKLAASRAAAGAKDDGRLKNNIYDGKVLATNTSFETPYLNRLKTQNTVKEAYDLYLQQRGSYWNDEVYLIDVSDYFRSANASLSNQIAYNLLETDNSSIAALRGLYLKAMSRNDASLALDVANVMFDRFPQRTQTYLDLALAYVANGDYQLGLDILTGIENGNINPNLDFNGLVNIADNEIKHLVGKHRDKLDLSKLKVQHLTAPDMDARIIFDWSKTTGEFELQFVNPAKRFFTWEHNPKDEKRIKDELLKGYNQEEFEINGGDKGQWLINVKYLGNMDKADTAPTFLKCTVYYNYGRANERKEQKVIRLHQIGREEQALRVLTQ